MPCTGIRVELFAAAGFVCAHPNPALKHVLDVGAHRILTTGITFLSIAPPEGITYQTQIVDGHANVGLGGYFLIENLPEGGHCMKKQYQNA